METTASLSILQLLHITLVPGRDVCPLFAWAYPARCCCLPPASVTGRSATADWCRVRWSGRLRLSGGRVGPKYFAGAAAAGSIAGRTNQTLLTLLPSDTICPCAAFPLLSPHLYVFLPVMPAVLLGQDTFEPAASQSSGRVKQDTVAGI